MEAIDNLKEINKLKKDIQAMEKDAKEKIKEYMQKNKVNQILLNDFSFYVTLQKVARESLDSKKLKEELPEIYEQYKKTQEYWRLDAKAPGKKLKAELEEKLKKQLKDGQK